MRQAEVQTGSVQQQYEKSNWIKRILLAVSILALLSLGIIFVTVGVADTSIVQVIHALAAFFQGTLEASPEASDYKIILLMRIPRVIMAILAGTGLSISGAAMQGITRNPLVSPFTIGVSSAAAVGASIAIVFGISFFPGYQIGIVTNAFMCAFACAILVYLVSKRVNMSAETVVLTGIALNYLFSAISSAIQFIAEEDSLAAVVQWTFGTFNGTTWNEVWIVGLFVLVCTGGIFCFTLKLNVMASGEDELVKSVGIDPARIRMIVGVLSVLMTAAVISFCGVIGFVGLVAPHIARLLVGNDHRYLLPFSAVLGSLLLLCADVLGRIILQPVSIPVGIIVSFLGVPLFIHQILKQRKEQLL